MQIIAIVLPPGSSIPERSKKRKVSKAVQAHRLCVVVLYVHGSSLWKALIATTLSKPGAQTLIRFCL